MKDKLSRAILILPLAIAILIIVGANIFRFYHNFNADIASEAVLARVVWETKSLIPDGWYPSSETRIIGTPNLASVFYGLTGSMSLAMGIACSIIALLIVASAQYMMRKWGSSLFGGVVASLLLIMMPANDTITELWLLRACYYGNCVIILLITMGIYGDIVRNRTVRWDQWLISILLAVGIGLQGMRGILVIYGPLVVVEGCRFLLNLIRGKKGALIPDSSAGQMANPPQVKTGLLSKAGISLLGPAWVLSLAVASYLATKAPFSTGQGLDLDLGNGLDKLIHSVFPNVIYCIGISGDSLISSIWIVACLIVMIVVVIRLIMLRDNRVILLLFGLLSMGMTCGCVAFTTSGDTCRYYFMLIISMAVAIGYFWDGIKTYSNSDMIYGDTRVQKISTQGISIQDNVVKLNIVTETIALILVIMIFVTRLFDYYVPLFKDNQYLYSSEYQVAQYLANKGIDRACATFERANSISVYSDGQVNVRTVSSMSDMNICYWLNYAGDFPDTVPYEAPTAYIVTEGERDGFISFTESVDGEFVLDTEIGGYSIYLSDLDYADKFDK